MSLELALDEVIESITARGVKLSLDLKVGGPEAVFTDEFVRALGAIKPLLVYQLARDALWEALKAMGAVDSAEPRPAPIEAWIAPGGDQEGPQFASGLANAARDGANVAEDSDAKRRATAAVLFERYGLAQKRPGVYERPGEVIDWDNV
jgi:hypothetical protein